MVLGDLGVCYRNPRVLRILKAVAPAKAEKIGAKKARDDRKKEAIIKKCSMGEGCKCRIRVSGVKRKKDGRNRSSRSRTKTRVAGSQEADSEEEEEETEQRKTSAWGRLKKSLADKGFCYTNPKFVRFMKGVYR